MMSSNAIATIDSRLENWFRAHGVEYEVHPHPLTYTALATARAEGVAPRTFAKVVGVRSAEGRVALVVVDAADVLDLARVSDLMGEHVRLLSEAELTAACPDWEVGTVPPVPTLAGAQVFADEGVRGDEKISFNAGSHRVAVRVDRAAWEEAAEITYGDLARRTTTDL
jgi:prolyl-tRNA editing enzyme YbaK/EbsC (Cys-tRNA(Pro) deacylase)